MLNSGIVRSLPKPTEIQWTAFAEHLITVHSWYKHLPLFGGGEFVIMLAPDAGEQYPTEHPRLPAGNTVDGYRLTFGHLDYLYRLQEHEPFYRDGPPTPELDDEVFNAGRFNLFPYVSNEFYWSVHENDVARIRDGVAHPHAQAILIAYDADQNVEQCWNGLSVFDREIAANIDEIDAAIERHLFPDCIERYLRLEKLASDSYLLLHRPEILKVHHSVSTFRDWLGST